MYAPVYFPPAPVPSPAVRAVERAILEAEGPYHVEGRYYPTQDNAERERRWAAERLVREAARLIETQTGTRQTATRRVPPSVRVSTWLTPRERSQVDAATDGHFVVLHRDRLGAVAADLALGQTDAALLSASLARPEHEPALMHLMHGLPGCVVAGLVGDSDEAQALSGTRLLGQAGVRLVIDGRTATGWTTLRRAFHPEHLPDDFLRGAVTTVVALIVGSDVPGGEARGPESSGCPAGVARFFGALFCPRHPTAQELAAEFGVNKQTFNSRFVRAGLPSPRQYLAGAWLVWAAHLSEAPGLTIADIAIRIGASSSQSFSRTVQHLLGMTATQFRREFTGDAMLERFCATLVTPYRDVLRQFDPFAPVPRVVEPSARARVREVARADSMGRGRGTRRVRRVA